MSDRLLKFRVWDKKFDRFLKQRHFGFEARPWFLLSFTGFICRFDGETIYSEDKGRFAIQQFIGLQDSQKKDVYEGDIVKFKYWVGDFAWEDMTEEEVKDNQEKVGQEYTGEVVWDEINAGFWIIVGDKLATHTRFPAAYVLKAKIVGNIFDNKELNEPK